MPTPMERLGEIFVVRRSLLQRLLDKILRRYTIQIVTYGWRLRDTTTCVCITYPCNCGEIVAVSGNRSFGQIVDAEKAFIREFPAYEYIYIE
jgi:hypothetical protein